MTRAAGRAEHGLFPRIPDAQPEMRAVADGAGDGVGERVQVEHHVTHAFACQPAQHALAERLAADRDGRLGDDARQRIESCAETGGEHERGQHVRACRGEKEKAVGSVPPTAEGR